MASLPPHILHFCFSTPTGSTLLAVQALFWAALIGGALYFKHKKGGHG